MNQLNNPSRICLSCALLAIGIGLLIGSIYLIVLGSICIQTNDLSNCGNFYANPIGFVVIGVLMLIIGITSIIGAFEFGCYINKNR